MHRKGKRNRQVKGKKLNTWQDKRPSDISRRDKKLQTLKMVAMLSPLFSIIQ
jgi:hypothetical protein